MALSKRATPLKFNFSLAINGNIYNLDLRHGDTSGWISYAYEFLDCYEIILNNQSNLPDTNFDRSAINGICSAIQDVVCTHEDTILFYMSNHGGFNNLETIWNKWSPPNDDVVCLTKTIHNDGISIYFGCFVRKDQRLMVSIKAHVDSISFDL